MAQQQQQQPVSARTPDSMGSAPMDLETPTPRLSMTPEPPTPHQSFDPVRLSAELKQELGDFNHRIRQAIKRHEDLTRIYDALPEDIKKSKEVPKNAHDDCFAEFGTFPGYTKSEGMYGRFLRTLAPQIEVGKKELEEKKLEDCLETVRTIKEFVPVAEKRLKEINEALKVHEKLAKKTRSR